MPTSDSYDSDFTSAIMSNLTTRRDYIANSSDEENDGDIEDVEQKTDVPSKSAAVDCCIFNITTGALVEVLGDSGAAMHVWPSDRVDRIHGKWS